MLNLIIKLNQNPMPDNCPFCGVEITPNIGAELFLTETENIVCLDCGMIHAPVLTTLLAFGDYSRLFDESGESVGKRIETYFQLSKVFVSSEKRFGDIWEENQNIERIPKNSFGIQPEVKANA